MRQTSRMIKFHIFLFISIVIIKKSNTFLSHRVTLKIYMRWLFLHSLNTSISNLNSVFILPNLVVSIKTVCISENYKVWKKINRTYSACLNSFKCHFVRPKKGGQIFLIWQCMTAFKQIKRNKMVVPSKKVWIPELLMVTRCAPNCEHDDLAECQESWSRIHL